MHPSANTAVDRESAQRLFDAARIDETAGRSAEATRGYEAAALEAARSGSTALSIEIFRRLAIVHHIANRPHDAATCGRRSLDLAQQIGDPRAIGEVLNTLASFRLENGDLETAERGFYRALEVAGESPLLAGRIEQNLGVVANIRGDLTRAIEHYSRSLTAFERAGDDRGCAIAYHNLGMVCADRGMWERAEDNFCRGTEIAWSIGDAHLRALCLVNRSEVFLARGDHEHARNHAEEALEVFERLGDLAGASSAHRFLGAIDRATGDLKSAETALNRARETAIEGRSPLDHGEALRELALVYQEQERNREALEALSDSRRIFSEIDARIDDVDADAKIRQLEETFLAIVRRWGESIESADAYTHGHCARVAEYALQVADQLDVDEITRTTVRVGAYLHDVGKVNVPPEILNKEGRLDDDEFAIVKQHPVFGVELLRSIRFPWDIEPIIRWHHERIDGSGYPDGLKGDEIPVTAQIISIVDAYDAMTSDRSYRNALTTGAAIAEIWRCRHWWSEPVVHAFMHTLEEIPHA